ncbi:MAG: transposase [Rubrobacter sp.]|nr:transposase [Rubrobacter sp.]
MHDPHDVLDANFYVLRGDCARRVLPHDFPPWKRAYHYFRFWRIDGAWEKLNGAIRGTIAPVSSWLI